MRTLFIAVNFVAGVLSLLIGVDIFLSAAPHPSRFLAGILALAMGAICLWLANQTVSDRQLQLL